MGLMNENELAGYFLKGSFGFGLILHILSIITRLFLIFNGPTLLMYLLPYMVMEVFFMYTSSMKVFNKSVPLAKTWVKVFAVINVLSFVTLIGFLLTFDTILGKSLEDSHISTIRSLMKLFCIILLSGPLISNTSFLGLCGISKQTQPSVSFDNFKATPINDWMQRRI